MIYPNLSPGKPWKDNLANAKLEKVTSEENKPKPESLIDMKSKTNDEILSPGGMAELMGQKLKIDETATDEVIFLISENGGNEIKVSYIYLNYPKNLQFEIPENLPAGNYLIGVRTRIHKGKVIIIVRPEQTLSRSLYSSYRYFYKIQIHLCTDKGFCIYE